ncbi:YcaO-like family protein [Sphaerisporangium corydalis]|uniref:YcaO-like family protein n=1 Tax=Sphaerisporangium corydalis TaxID=1441875 RepID=A0ABV9EC37_9ACTN|nr:YcaO-like family protein [Sphaerisporangium corydalis]
MAPKPDSTPSAISAPRSPVHLQEVAECFGGEAYLAYAQRPESGVVTVAAGFTPDVARGRAKVRAAALDALYQLPDGVTERRAGRELSLADFMPEPPADNRARVGGVGLLSRERYLLPAEVVWMGDRDCRVEPTAVGVIGDTYEGVSGAIADLLAHDMVTRWWANPRMPLLRVSDHLDALISPGAAAAVPALGLRVSAFVLPGPDFQIAVVGLSGEGTTIATAAARSAREAVREAFLRAVAARSEPWNTLSTADSLRRLTVWHREVDYLAYLEWSALDADPSAFDRSEAADEPPSWADIAARRFGHEPILVGLGAFDDPVKVVCPGAACYRTVPPGTTLPCPVP